MIVSNINAVVPITLGAIFLQKGKGALIIPEGEWQPPDAGDAPGEIKSILRTVYSGCRDKNPAETPEAKQQCASIAWGAVKNAGWNKDPEGKWVKEEKQTNISEITTETEDIVSFHNVDIQRLEVFHTNNGVPTFYPEKYFTNVSDWEGIPVVYQRTPPKGGRGKHIGFCDVIKNEFDPASYVKVGRLTNVRLAERGEPTLTGEIVFNNPSCTLAAKARELSISTGFSAPIENLDDGRKTIAGQVAPNHLLLFKRGSCPNCYPNDPGARLLNLIGSDKHENTITKGDDEMDDESKGYLKTIAEGIKNMITMDKATPDASKNEEQKMTEIKNEGMDYKAAYEELKAKYDALMKKQGEMENMTNLVDQYKKANDEAKVAFENIAKENADLKWMMVKNILPRGWVDTPEHEEATRKEYTDTPHEFAQKLARVVNQTPPDKPAQGTTVVNQVAEENKDWGTIPVGKK